MKKHEVKRKGFTLVELLIVIVVIGVLSAMMMLSSTEAVSSAKASNIISNLRNMKTAALAWYADNLDNASEFGTDDVSGDIFKYLGDTGNKAGYKFSKKNGTNVVSWDVEYDGADLTPTVRTKLSGRASSTGITVPDSGAVSMFIQAVSTK